VPAGRFDRLSRASEKAWARTVSDLVISPGEDLGQAALATRPRARSVSGIDGGVGLIGFEGSRLITAYSTRNGFLNPFRFRRRRAMGSGALKLALPSRGAP